MTAPATFPAPADRGAIDLAAQLTAYADGWEDRILDLNWQREDWEHRQAKQQAMYFAGRRDCEVRS